MTAATWCAPSRAEHPGLGRPARRRTIKGGSDFLIAINAQGRLRTAQEFGDIVLKTGSNGEVVRLSDVARVELGASDYTLRGQLDHYNTSIIGVFQAPGANALATRDAVIAKMDELARQFPPGVSYDRIMMPRSLCENRSRPSFTRCSRRSRWSCW